MRPRFTGVCLVTGDMPALAAFYARILGSAVEGDDVFATVPAPGATLTFYATSGMEQMAPGSTAGAGTGGYTLEFEVDDVDEAHARLCAQGVPIVKAPTTQPLGRRSVWLRDPNGNVINLYQPVPPVPEPAELVRRYFQRLLVDRDPSVCEAALLADDYVDNDAPPGPHATRAYVERMLRDYPT